MFHSEVLCIAVKCCVSQYSVMFHSAVLRLTSQCCVSQYSAVFHGIGEIFNNKKIHLPSHLCVSSNIAHKSSVFNQVE